MISKLQLIVLAIVLLGTMVLLGSLRPFHPSDSYCLVGGAVMIVEAALALCFARGVIADAFAAGGQGNRIGWSIQRVVGPLVVLVAAAMVPTVVILYANQALDAAPVVTQTLPVLRAPSRSHKGGTTYYATVPATTPAPLLSDPQTDIPVSYETWQRLVPGRSTMTLSVHPGRFGLPWYDSVVVTAL